MNLLSLILLALSSGINVHQNYHWTPENLELGVHVSIVKPPPPFQWQQELPPPPPPPPPPFLRQWKTTAKVKKEEEVSTTSSVGLRGSTVELLAKYHLSTRYPDYGIEEVLAPNVLEQHQQQEQLAQEPEDSAFNRNSSRTKSGE
ncbi:hypothetical protein TYRP_002753 [Tyrophagus putrescentiae]|nr:hypothetical protein TYRP_002753 [Tyrophagus putrescentiae]